MTSNSDSCPSPVISPLIFIVLSERVSVTAGALAASGAAKSSSAVSSSMGAAISLAAEEY